MFVEKAVEGSMDIWRKYLTHPFITEMADGTLPEDKFVGYLVQDTIYLREYARVYAMAMYKSDTIRDIREYYSVLSFVNENESSQRLVWLSQRGLSDSDIDKMPAKAENRRYCDFMLKIAGEYGAPEILMAVLPCMFSYAFIFKTVLDKAAPKYREFIEGYADQGYIGDCRRWAAFAEEKCAGLPKERQDALVEIFRKSSLCEMDFWDMAYKG